MKKRTLIIILGLWVAIVPFLGLPGVWKNNIFKASGVVIALVAATRKRAPKIISDDPSSREKPLAAPTAGHAK